MVESASTKQKFLGLFIKHLVEDLITYPKQQQQEHTNHHPIIDTSRNRRKHLKKTTTQCKRLLLSNRTATTGLNGSLEDADIIKADGSSALDSSIIAQRLRPEQQQQLSTKDEPLERHHGRPNNNNFFRNMIFIASQLPPKYNRLNLKYFSSRKTAKRLRYLLSLDAKKKPR